MPFDATKSPVPREFWGLARELHKEAKAGGEEIVRRLKQIDTLVGNTLDRTFNSKLSPHTRKAALRLWQAVPREFLIKEANSSKPDTLE